MASVPANILYLNYHPFFHQSLMLVINTLRVNYGSWVGDWTEMLLIGPVSVALPLIPLGLPLAWLILNWLGIARILTMYHHACSLQVGWLYSWMVLL